MDVLKPEDINDNVRRYCDTFFKKVIQTTSFNLLRNICKAEKYNISIVNIEDVPEMIFLTAKDFIPLYEEMMFKNVVLQFSDTVLVQAVQKLTFQQRTVLLENIVFGFTLAEIADELHICVRMVQKHKFNALQKLRGVMGDEKN